MLSLTNTRPPICHYHKLNCDDLEAVRKADGNLFFGYRAAVPNSDASKSCFWRSACASVALSIVILCAVTTFYVFAFSNTISATLDHVQIARPGILLETVDDARMLLHGAARTSSSAGDLTQSMAPSLVNMTSASARMMERISQLVETPLLTLALGHGGGM
jgi:hypothetical protein